jgi:hypothetical protein
MPSAQAAFSCVTEVEQRPQREEEPHDRNGEPPTILLCHESPAELAAVGDDRLSVSGELCGTARSKRRGGPPGSPTGLAQALAPR